MPEPHSAGFRAQRGKGHLTFDHSRDILISMNRLAFDFFGFYWFTPAYAAAGPV
jgi:hypothetical protein